MFIKSMFILLAFATMPTILETPIVAEVVEICTVFDDKNLSNPLAQLTIGSRVEILQDYSAQVYKIFEPFTQVAGWVEGVHLLFPPESRTDNSILQADELTRFANSQGYTSKTEYLLITDIGRQKIHVFRQLEHDWVHLQSFDCSTGLNTSPTTRGIFTITSRGPWFYSERLSSGAKFWMRFNEQYLIHSIPMDRHMNIIAGEDVVGEKRSNGCIRLMPQDAKWIYENVPDGTTIVII